MLIIIAASCSGILAAIVTGFISYSVSRNKVKVDFVESLSILSKHLAVLEERMKIQNDFTVSTLADLKDNVNRVHERLNGFGFDNRRKG